MSQNITLNGNVYIIPDVGDTGWGQNLTNYFVAIPAGVLQKSAGLFTLTADVDFGANFGVKSIYYKTETTGGAAAGQIRLAKTDTISFRNNAGGGDLPLGIDSSDRLTFNGVPIESNALTNAHILVGNASNVATDVAMSGDVAITNAGATSVNNVQAGVITNAMINATAAIAVTKLANGTADQIFGTNHTGTASEFKTLTGTTNQITVTGSAGAITFATPQDINTSSSPTFAGLTVTKNNTAEVLAKTTSTTQVGTLYAQNDLGNGVEAASFGSAFPGTVNGHAVAGLGALICDTSALIYTASSSTFLSFGINAVEKLKIDSTGLTLAAALTVANGGTGDTTFTAYSVICAGTTATGAFQNVSGLGSSGQVLTSNGAGALPTWTNAPGTGTVNSGTATHLAYYATSTNAVSSSADLYYDSTNHRFGIAVPSPTYPLQVQADSGTAAISILGRSSDDVSAVQFIDHTNTTTQGFILASPTSIKFRAGPSTDAIIAKTSGVAVLGTNTNDSATSGYVGETVSSAVSSTNLFSGSYQDLTSINLTAGDWLISGVWQFFRNGATIASIEVGMSTTAGNNTTGLSYGDNRLGIDNFTFNTGSNAMPLAIPSWRLSLSGSATVYLKYDTTFTVATAQAAGRISAVRIR